MSSSPLEHIRLVHQDIELHKRAAVKELLDQTKASRDHLMLEHRVKEHLHKIRKGCRTLLELYADESDLQKQELAEIGGENPLASFYERLKTLREYHRTHTNASQAKLSETDVEVQPKVQFSAEEHYGKYVDMHALYERYINLPQFSRKDYVTFLTDFAKFDRIPANKKMGTKSAEYREYLGDLAKYLIQFFERTKPLANIQKILGMIDEDFLKLWDDKKAGNWFTIETEDEKEKTEKVQTKETEAKTEEEEDDEDEEKKKEEQKNQQEKKKEEEKQTQAKKEKKKAIDVTIDEEKFLNNPLYCRACKKLFTKDTVFKGHLTGRKHQKAEELLKLKEKAEKQNSDLQVILIQSKLELHRKNIAALEHKIATFADLLAEVISETQKFIEKKQTQTVEEIERENMLAERPQQEADEDSDEEDAKLANPLNLPLGWDGKPIPYWLYKLHGLNIEYKCQICGGYTYRGPRNFERHFTEWRHTYGMRCLGIPNGKEFLNITTFEDAKALWEKMQREQSQKDFRPEDEEECEDNEGNVYDRKTYEALKKSGRT
eukprot:TRINITY_DN5217_c0_g1_i1.p1 TRINITY_DN5217_c0_g1~~TRINITY_DN5217_c0_g1_i1.p1  ORF type:complete len:547 (+),score=146.86 TRINITY_DN5217_c0_g1_i1:64-1704(+)